MNANSCDKHCIRTHFNTELEVLYPSLVRMRKVLVRPWVLLLLLFYIFKPAGQSCFILSGQQSVRAFWIPFKISLFSISLSKGFELFENPMSTEPFVSLAKAPPVKRSRKGYGNENGIIILLLSPRVTETANTLVWSLEAKKNFAFTFCFPTLINYLRGLALVLRQ